MNYLDELWQKYRREKTIHQYSGVAFKQAVTEALEKQRKLTLSEYNQWEKIITSRTPQDVISDTKLEEL